MIASVIAPLAVTVSINVILYIYAYASTASLLQKTQGDISLRYLNSNARLRDDVIVLILLIVNFIFGYLSLLPTTSYFSQPCLCFLCVILGFALIFLYIIRKPFTYLEENKEIKKWSELTAASSEGEKRSTRLGNEQQAFYINKTQGSKENIYEKQLEESNEDHPPQHVEKWYRHSKKLTDDEIPRARVSSFNSSFHNNNSSSNRDRSSSVLSNGRQSAYFNPNSVPMTQIEHSRFEKYFYREEDDKEAYNYANGGYKQDYF